ncbi:MAG: nucleoside monophosphate kinase [Verrucomicrobiota bacterium]|nr:nucleoside monophosphate kinase [Verrucomicrobiota bacterium]
MTLNTQLLVFLGPPGSGKGTHAKALSALPGFVHISMGEVFRGLDPKSSIGLSVQEVTANGNLVPDALTLNLFRKKLSELSHSSNIDFVILDGIPRTLVQAQDLDHDLKISHVFHFKCEVEEIRSRIVKRSQQQQRLDDQDHTVLDNRLKVYEKHASEIVAFFGPRVVSLDTSRKASSVLRDLLNHLV